MERTPSEIGDLLVRAILQDLSPEEQEFLENWGDLHPSHRKWLEQAADPKWLKELYKEVNGLK